MLINFISSVTGRGNPFSPRAINKIIRIICLCNVYLHPTFIVKLGRKGVYLIFLLKKTTLDYGYTFQTISDSIVSYNLWFEAKMSKFVSYNMSVLTVYICGDF